MRKRKEIEGELHRPIATSQRMDNLKVELLLDIRDLLFEEKARAIRKSLSRLA